MYTIIYRDKTLFTSKRSLIYQNENRADYFKFLVSINDLSAFAIDQMQCSLCISLPDNKTGKLSMLNFSTEYYNDEYLLSTLPITKTITKYEGDILLWLNFTYEDADGYFHNLPTNKIAINILPSSSYDTPIDPDETTDSFAALSQQVNSLEKRTVTVAEIIDGNSLVFYSDSGKTKELFRVKLQNGIEWSTLEDVL